MHLSWGRFWVINGRMSSHIQIESLVVTSAQLFLLRNVIWVICVTDFLMEILGSGFFVCVTILHLILSCARHSFQLCFLIFVSTFFHFVDSFLFLLDLVLFGFSFGFSLPLDHLILLLLPLMFYPLLCFLLLGQLWLFVRATMPLQLVKILFVLFFRRKMLFLLLSIGRKLVHVLIVRVIIQKWPLLVERFVTVWLKMVVKITVNSFRMVIELIISMPISSVGSSLMSLPPEPVRLLIAACREELGH